MSRLNLLRRIQWWYRFSRKIITWRHNYVINLRKRGCDVLDSTQTHGDTSYNKKKQSDMNPSFIFGLSPPCHTVFVKTRNKKLLKILYFAGFTVFSWNLDFFPIQMEFLSLLLWLREIFKIPRNQVCWKRSVRFADTLIEQPISDRHFRYLSHWRCTSVIDLD